LLGMAAQVTPAVPLAGTAGRRPRSRWQLRSRYLARKPLPCTRRVVRKQPKLGSKWIRGDLNPRVFRIHWPRFLNHAFPLRIGI